MNPDSIEIVGKVVSAAEHFPEGDAVIPDPFVRLTFTDGTILMVYETQQSGSIGVSISHK